jgi:uncharacterized protein DUF397
MTTECDLVWRRSSFSGSGGTGGGNCVEAAVPPGRLELRDSKNPGLVLELPRPALTALLRHLG